MRITPVLVAAVLLAAGPATAQEWIEYQSPKDGFSVNFPSQPTVTDIVWTSEYEGKFPAHVYSVASGASKYSVTVVDYRTAERVHAEMSKTEAALQGGNIYWQVDIQGSIAYVATQFRERPGVKVTFDAYHYVDLVSGHQLQLTNPDQSRTFVGLYLHENRLYILEATVPPRAPQPGLFQQSLGFVDEKGGRVRYREIYSNRLPPRAPRPAAPGADAPQR